MPATKRAFPLWLILVLEALLVAKLVYSGISNGRLGVGDWIALACAVLIALGAALQVRENRHGPSDPPKGS